MCIVLVTEISTCRCLSCMGERCLICFLSERCVCLCVCVCVSERDICMSSVCHICERDVCSILSVSEMYVSVSRVNESFRLSVCVCVSCI